MADISTIIEIILARLDFFDISRIMKVSEIHSGLPLEVAASRFAALGSEQRLLVLHALVRAGREGLSIGELGERVGIHGSTLTHHVKILTAAGLVRQEKRGRSIICAAADYEVMEALSGFLLSECCADCSLEANHD